MASSSAQAKPAFQLDPSGKWVVLLSHLYNDSTCTVREFRGVVIKRQFEEDRVSVAGLILELPDGSRHFINVDVDHAGLTLNASGWIISGLETLLSQNGHDRAKRTTAAAGRDAAERLGICPIAANRVAEISDVGAARAANETIL